MLRDALGQPIELFGREDPARLMRVRAYRTDVEFQALSGGRISLRSGDQSCQSPSEAAIAATRVTGHDTDTTWGTVWLSVSSGYALAARDAPGCRPLRRRSSAVTERYANAPLLVPLYCTIGRP
ncbi:hypothetical protein BH24CHL9_BH24CHL9_10030 [soil metagenome]